MLGNIQGNTGFEQEILSKNILSSYIEETYTEDG